jgi:release factor glutamine methyltransferase
MKTVYQPAEDSLLMLEALEYCGPKTGDRVLDMGTGSGVLAIAAARRGSFVTAADVNPEAIEYARAQAEKERLKIEFVVSDLFEKIRNRYDLITFNPPYVKTEDGEKKDMQSIAWDGGADGAAVISKFLHSAPVYLNSGGRIMMLTSSPKDEEPLFPGFKQRVINSKPLSFEQLYVLELSPRKVFSHLFK